MLRSLPPLGQQENLRVPIDAGPRPMGVERPEVRTERDMTPGIEIVVRQNQDLVVPNRLGDRLEGDIIELAEVHTTTAGRS